jgi:hypothetical protein
MGRLLWLAAALGAAGCGKVSLVADAASDGPDPDAYSCSGAKLACFAGGASSCVDPMSDKMNCGSCGTACATGEECATGHCADTTASCFAIKSYHPDSMDGMYTHELDGAKFYCDMTNGGVTYSNLSIGQFDVGHSGYVMLTLADFQTVAVQTAFIALMNAQQGAARLDTGTAWTVGNCCFKYSATAMQYLAFGLNNFIEPADTAGNTVCGGVMSMAAYSFSVTAASPQALPLPTDFFTTRAPQNYGGCIDGANPAYYWKKSL